MPDDSPQLTPETLATLTDQEVTDAWLDTPVLEGDERLQLLIAESERRHLDMEAALRAMPAYKFVDLAYADSVAAGAIRVGTFLGYASQPGERADSLEGSTLTSVENYTFTNNDPRAREWGAQVDATSSIHIIGSTRREKLPDCYLFCMSASLRARPKHPHATFLIKEPHQLGVALLSENMALFGPRVMFSRVTYRRRTFSFPQDPHERPHPMIKDPSCAWENEIRIVFEGVNTGSGAVVTRPSKTIADFFERIS